MAYATKWGGLGRLPDLKDQRDWRYASVVERPELAISLPASLDFRESGFLPSTWDQGQLGSCVPHGGGRALVYDLAKQGLISHPDDYMPSRLGIYWYGRKLENTIGEDSGLTISDGIKVLANPGTGPEEDWPYDISKFTVTPPQKLIDHSQYDAVKYARVPQTTKDIQTILASGLPVVIGFSVYESFESDAVARNGVVPLPSGREQILGGHCMCVIGYKMIGSRLYWICNNSWGTGWGERGICYMPETYLTNQDLADDFWTIQLVTSPSPTPAPPAPPTPVEDFVQVADDVAKAFDGVIPTGTLTFVRDINRPQGLVERVWKKGGYEIGVKRLHF